MEASRDAHLAAEWPELYEELRRLAGVFLEGERPGHTLQPTALVHEAFVRLAGSASAPLTDRVTFLAAAANTMRRVLVDHARAKRCQKRGGRDGQRVPLDTAMLVAAPEGLDVLEVEDALRRLVEVEPRLARLVELRYFGGLNEEEAAAVLRVSRRTAQVDWRAAKAWLRRELLGPA